MKKRHCLILVALLPLLLPGSHALGGGLEASFFEVAQAADAAARAGSLETAAGYYEHAVGLLEQLEASPGEWVDLNATDIRSRRANLLLAIGQIYLSAGYLERPRPFFERALQANQVIKDANFETDVRQHLAYVRFMNGDLEQALADFHDVVKMARGINDKAIEAMANNNLALVNMQLGDFQSAQQNLNDVLVLNRSLELPGLAALAELNQAQLHAQFGDLPRALASAEKAQGMFAVAGLHERVLESLTLQVEFYRQMGDISKTLEKLEESRTFIDQHGGELSEATKNVNSQIGRLFLMDMGLLVTEPPADDHFANGLIALRREEYARSIEILEKGDASSVASQAFNFHTALGLANENLKNSAAARQQFEQAIEVIEGLRDQLHPAARHRFFSKKEGFFARTEPYEGMVRTLAAAGQADEAFRYSESIKARKLLETTSRGRVRGVALVPDEVRRQEDEMEARVRRVSVSIADLMKKHDASAINAKRNELAEARRERDAFIETLRGQYPEYADLRYPRPATPRDVRLEPGETLVAFEVTDPETLVFVLRDGKLTVHRAAIERHDLKKKVNEFRAFFEEVANTDDLARFDPASARGLYDLLLKQPLAQVPAGSKLVLVPDENLCTLPFDALVVAQTGANATVQGAFGPYPKNVTYLADRYEIAYAQSASALTLARLDDAGGGHADRVLTVADPVFSATDPRVSGRSVVMTDQDRALVGAIAEWRTLGVQGTRERAEFDPDRLFPRLERTGELAEHIQTLFGPATQTMVGPQAEEGKIKGLNLGSYRYAVFATHGILDDMVPMIQEPALVLTQVGRGVNQDGFLTMSEVLAMKLDADVVVLTACETGRGEMVAGEGVMGMGRAFQYAGSRNVLMTLWSVAEDSTTDLTTTFLHELAGGRTPSESLKKARATVRQKGYEHPFYWAGFVLTGSGKSGTLDVAPATPGGGVDAASSEACDGGDAAACFRLGENYRDGKDVAANDSTALGLFLKSCDGGNADGCNQAGFMIGRGRGREMSFPEAFKYYQKGCQGGNVEACYKTGSYAKYGRLGPADHATAVPILTDACARGWMDACVELGDTYFKGLGVTKDAARAATLFDQACKKESAWGCNYLGVLHVRGEGVAKNQARGIELYESACAKNFGVACDNLGYVYHDGKAGNADYSRAAEYFEKGCKAGYTDSCTKLGWMLLQGKGFPVDVDQANKRFQESCDAGSLWGCHTLGESYENGRGVARSYEEAARLYQKACDAGRGGACADLADLVSGGLGVPQDEARAATLYDKGCAGNNGYGCRKAGFRYRDGKGVEKDAEKSFELFSKASSLGDDWSLIELGYAYKKGVGVEADEKKALEYYGLACEKGYGDGCSYQGEIYAKKEAFAKAVPLYRLGCEKKDGWACDQLGDYYERDDRGVAKDLSKAMEFHLKGCELKEEWGCISAGDLYRDGEGVARDVDRAIELYQKGCNMGSGAACYRLARRHMYGDNDPASFQGNALNATEAIKYLMKACELDEADACGDLGFVLYTNNLVEQAVPVLEKACEKNSAAGCNTLGAIYMTGPAPYRSQFFRAEGYFARGCAAGFGKACHNLAAFMLQHDAGNYEGCKMMEKACEMGEQMSCDALEKIKEDCRLWKRGLIRYH